MKPWSHDASELNPKDIPSAYIYKNQTIEEYLQPVAHERKLFLIGPKGCGKTLLLRYKAYLYWNKMVSDEQQEYKVSATNELVESLDFDLDTLSKKELQTLATLQTWRNIWKFSLTLLAIRRLKMNLPMSLSHIDKDFPTYFRLGNIVTELITNQPKYITSNFFRENLNQMSALLNDLNHPFILFIDRLDQALDPLLSSGEYKYYDAKNGDHVPFKVWQYAQCGLLISSYNFTTAINRHIKIFATARKEALDVETQLIANITGFCTYLDYTKKELKEIFENNIQLTPQKFLNPEYTGADLYQSFFGFKEMPHVQVKDENQQYRVENVFDFILRHTFERPREVVQMGRLIYEQLLPRDYHFLSTEKKIERVRSIVNKTAHETVLNNYLKEVIPAFRDEYVDICAEKFKQNLIFRRELNQVSEKIINYLYRIGLIGYVQQNRQVFLPASKHMHDYSEAIQMSTHYMLHPCLDHRLQQKRDFNEFYNEYCIIGNGYPFYPPPIFNNKSRSDHDVTFYLPKALPGKRDEENSWKKAKITVDVEVLFKRYFIEESDENQLMKFQKTINEALRILTLLANLKAIELLRKKFSSTRNRWLNWEKELEHKLTLHSRKYKYTQTISDISSNSLKLFEGRVFGRLIAAGMLIYLDTDYYGVKNAVQNFSVYRPNEIDVEESAVRFLRTAFFIAYLPNIAPYDRNVRSKLLNGLSNFEQQLLKRWWLQYTEHVLFEKAYFDSEHISYLKNIVK